jgi:putative salt-induced outer membrane protein YdiY
MHKFIFSFLILFPLICLKAEPTDGFITDLNFGLTLNRGNTENSLLNAGVETRHRTEEGDFRASLVYNYGETTRVEGDGTSSTFTSTDNTRANLQYNYLFSERAYGLVALSAFRDELADVQYRILTGPGLGYFLVRNDVWSLAVEAGLSYLIEDVDDVTDDYAVLRFAQMYERDLSENASVWQNLEYLPEADDFENYLLNFEIGARARLNGNLSLRVVLTQRYDNTPGQGNERSDWSLVSGISYRL